MRVVFKIRRPIRGSAREFSKLDAHSEGLRGLFSKLDAHSEGLNGLLHVATTHSVGRMVFYMLQQPIRWAEWSFTCCNNPFGGSEWAFALLQQPIRWAEWAFTCCNTISYACKPLLHRWDDPSAVAERLFPQHSNHVLSTMCYKQMDR